MKTNNIISMTVLVIAGFSFIFELISCKKEPEVKSNLPYEWVKNGHQLTYDYYSSNDTTLDALVITINDYFGTEKFEFGTDYPQWQGIPPPFSFDIMIVVRKFDGIYQVICTKPNFSGCSEHQEFMRAPQYPKLNQVFNTYYNDYKVTNQDTQITVPSGTFKTFVLQHTSYLDKEYWSEKDGLIMMEKINSQGKVEGRFELSSRNH